MNESNSPYQRETKRKHPGLRVIVLFTLLVICIGYSAYWFWYAAQIKGFISEKKSDLLQKNIRFQGEPKITGFPLGHEVRFSGQVLTPGLIYYIPNMTLSGITLPQSPVQISFPEGLGWSPKNDPKPLYTIDKLSMTLKLPDEFPKNVDHDSLEQWQKNNPPLFIQDFQLLKPPLELGAQGHVSLDAELQPMGEIRIVSLGHQELVDNLIKDNVLNPQETAILKTLTNGLTSQDEETGQKILRLDLRLASSRLYVGPVPVLRLPEISWRQAETPNYKTLQ